MISDYDMKKLIHDLKRISRLVHIVKNLGVKKSREETCQVIMDELQRLEDDLEEIRKSKNGKTQRNKKK